MKNLILFILLMLNKMKICCISDTHSQHNEISHWLKNENNSIDMIIHSGDVSTRGYKAEVKSFLDWFSSLNFKYKIFIAGNHDFFFDYNWKAQTLVGKERHNHIIASQQEINEILNQYPNIIYLNDSGIEIEGLKIFGSPVQPWFHDWAFNRMRGEDIQKHWDLIPENTDILITHGPSSDVGYLDLTLRGHEKVGCKDLSKTIASRLKNLIFHQFGHIHEGFGIFQAEILNNDNIQPITFINASSLNVNYESVNKPIIVEIIDKKIISIISE